MKTIEYRIVACDANGKSNIAKNNDAHYYFKPIFPITSICSYKHLYVVSNEIAKSGDLAFDEVTGGIFKRSISRCSDHCFKITNSTDPKDNLPPVSNDDIYYFINNFTPIKTDLDCDIVKFYTDETIIIKKSKLIDLVIGYYKFIDTCEPDEVRKYIEDYLENNPQ